MHLDDLPIQRSELLPERIASTLRKAIVDGRIPPGAKLIESELSRQMQVSRVPLREAFRVLEGEGIVTIKPNRGAIVSELSDAEMIELFGVRAIFEASAAETLALSRPEGVLAELRQLILEMRTAVAHDDLDRYYLLAAAFHDVLVAGSANQTLIRLYGVIKLQLRRYQAAMAGVPRLAPHSIEEHEGIVIAIRDGDAPTATRLARSHIEDLITRFLAHKAGKQPSARAAPG